MAYVGGSNSHVTLEVARQLALASSKWSARAQYAASAARLGERSVNAAARASYERRRPRGTVEEWPRRRRRRRRQWGRLGHRSAAWLTSSRKEANISAVVKPAGEMQ